MMLMIGDHAVTATEVPFLPPIKHLQWVAKKENKWKDFLTPLAS